MSGPLVSTLKAFRRDRRGASAVEFAIVAMPFILLVLAILQLGIYFMTQASLDAGVIKTADYLVNSYYSGSAPATLTPSALQTMVISNSGGLLTTSTLTADLKKLSALSTGAVAISSTVDANSPGDVLALRAQGTMLSFVPGLSTIYVRSTALLRRQNT